MIPLVLCHPRYFAKQGSFRQLAFPVIFPLSKIRFFTPPVVPLSKIFARFPQQIPNFHPSLKNIFYFSFDAVFRFTYRHLVNSIPRPDLIAVLTAVADSIATAQPVSIPVTDIDSAIRFIRSRFVDVDWDTYPDRITIFGDDSSIPVSESGDGYEGHFVLNLVFPVTPFVDTNAL